MTTHQNTSSTEKISNIMTMLDFVFHLRNMTTSELCKTYPNTFVMPTWNGSQDDMVKSMLAVDAILWKMTGEYAKFLYRPLKKGFFVPCDKDDNILEEPISYDGMDSGDSLKLQEYEKAKDQILFKGYKVLDILDNENPISKTIFHPFADRPVVFKLLRASDFWISAGLPNISSISEYKIELTDRALKEIGLS
jgi:hypothetical protein